MGDLSVPESAGDGVVTDWLAYGETLSVEPYADQIWAGVWLTGSNGPEGWTNTSAVRSSQVYCISDELLNTPAPTLVSGLRALAGAIHPEIFGSQMGLRSVTQVPGRQVVL